MNHYQQLKYARELNRLSSSQLEAKLNVIKHKIKNCLENNRKKELRHRQQEKKIIEQQFYK